MIGVQRVSLAAIVRCLLGGVKDLINRVWRFCANDRIETGDATGFKSAVSPLPGFPRPASDFSKIDALSQQ
jgi:hypothetical protein